MNMPTTNADFNPTMSSREIAELVEKRHDNVKRTIEDLKTRDLVHPQIEDVQELGANGRTYTTSVYRLEKRDSYVVVAQLSPEFTARLVDRWQELEDERANGGWSIPKTLPDALRLAAEQADQIAEMQDDVDALALLAKADGSLNITEVAKNLGVRPTDLFKWLSSNGWIYKRPGSGSWLGYAARCNNGDLEHKTTTTLKADGNERICEQVRVTAQGLAKLAKLIKPSAEAA